MANGVQLKATVTPESAGTAAAITPAEFLQRLTELARTRRVQEAAAFFDNHSADVRERLSRSQRYAVEEVMEYVDTVVDLQDTRGGSEE
jgi:hypothetical protein